MKKSFLHVLAALLSCLSSLSAADKPRITLDEYFDSVSISDVKIAFDGRAVVIATERADWENNRYRKDLWLWRASTRALVPLTQSGHDSDAQWSPDGRWIAFLSDRTPQSDVGVKQDAEPAKEQPAHLYVISAEGGEAFAVTRGEEEVHAFAWSADSRGLFFATRVPWSKTKREAYKKEWQDVTRWRESERGDVIARISLAEATSRALAITPGSAVAEDEKTKKEKDAKEETALTPGAVLLATIPLRVRNLAPSPDGKWLGFDTDSISQRVETPQAYEIYLLDLTAGGGAPRQLTHNQAIEEDLGWSPDSRELFFMVRMGAVESKYSDVQNRVYSVTPAGEVRRWGEKFLGAVDSFATQPDGALVIAGQQGTQQPLLRITSPAAAPVSLSRQEGTYGKLSVAKAAPAIAYVYSRLNIPSEVYLSSDGSPASATAITSFNKLFTERELPQGRPYRWKSDDGTEVEGMLVYPPGQFGGKKLPTLVLIHGGPQDADGDRFGADWYEWAILAASRGWLVFRPNYRGSSGYGDKFMREIVPHLVSVPGKDILTGVDALVRDGIADPDRLTIGGYSYGGYMSNWLITQTSRFKAAVTGAGAVEHAANWGNDDLTFDDAFFLGGAPWEVPQMYHDEAALWQLNKVRTPTHIVVGAEDIRVSAAENYLLERALHTLNVPSSLLVFPGEGHSLKKNPWHGKIKVREELNWLQKYVPLP